MFTKPDCKRCCELIKEKFFASVLDDETLMILAPGGKEYYACIFDDNESSNIELYMYRLLTREEYDKFNSLHLAENWFVEANEKKTAFALIYEKHYRYFLGVDENNISTAILKAIEYIEKEILL